MSDGTTIGSGFIKSDTITLTTTPTSVGIPSGKQMREITFQADPDNVNDIWIGDSEKQTIHLLPGMSIDLSVADIELVYGKTLNSTAVLNWVAVGQW